MSGHTPGPWSAKPAADKGWDVVGPDGKIVAFIALRYGDPEMREHLHNARLLAAAPEMLEALKHNARLLAAAPEMLEALKGCVSYLGELDITDPEWGDVDAAELESAVRKAIAKAEGKRT